MQIILPATSRPSIGTVANPQPIRTIMASKKSPKKQAATPSSRSKSSTKTKSKPAAAAKPRKTAAPKKPQSASRKKTTKRKADPKPAPSREAVAHAAYLNYRRRVEKGLPGDSHGDWLEAERQLGIRE
jgi:hypothetical protein